MFRAEQSRAEQTIRLGNVYDDEKFTGGNYGGHVWDANGIAPTLKTGSSASQQFVIDVVHLGSKKDLTSEKE